MFDSIAAAVASSSVAMFANQKAMAEATEWKEKQHATYAQAAYNSQNAQLSGALSQLGLQQAPNPWGTTQAHPYHTSTSTVTQLQALPDHIRQVVQEIFEEKRVEAEVQRSAAESGHTHFMISSVDCDYCLCGHKVYHAQAGFGHRAHR